MSGEITILAFTALSIGFFHTLLGPDHYIPFIMMSKAGKWSLKKTIIITILCGIGHILSSIILGLVGIGLGIAVLKLEVIESFRGQLAAWLLIAFGLVYFAWGLRRAIRNKPHEHWHAHHDDEFHVHDHTHHEEHLHIHKKEGSANTTPWILFTIFVFGPCEPLIPILMYPAAKSSILGLIFVAATFALATIITMLSIVILSYSGLSFLPQERLERYAHAIAGATICLCGLAIQFLGL